MELGNQRKREQVAVASTREVASALSAGWTDIHFLHRSLPEINRDDIDLSASFLGRRFKYPLVISALTGGYQEAETINRTLGRLAADFDLLLEIGSQRPMLGRPELSATYAAARRAAPSAFIAANIGVGQLIAQGESPPLSPEQVATLISAIEADALVVHLNFLQEAVMPEGDRQARGCLAAIGRLAATLSVPVIAKETGSGISGEQAQALKAAGVAALDVGGAGGTSMALVESYRARPQNGRVPHPGQTFSSWGIPTAVAVVEARGSGLPLIASGGVRTGLDGAKALALGASLVGVAHPWLAALERGYQGAREYLEGFIGELAVAMFLVGAAKLSELGDKKLVVTGATRDWLTALGHDINLGREYRGINAADIAPAV
ncbi:MAG: type 2 isopentenyl-diphosphate Delta-isomerase [Chloroflexota bacterium]